VGTAGSNRRAFFGSGWNIRPLLQLISCGGLNGFLVHCRSPSVDDRGPLPSNPLKVRQRAWYERTGPNWPAATFLARDFSRAPGTARGPRS